MFPWKKKKEVQEEPAMNFHQRVGEFWEWYESNSVRLLDAIDDGQASALAPEISQRAGALWPGAAWVFGPPPEDTAGHSFTLTGEGDIHKQLLARHWMERAPEIKGWTFHASRQPGEVFPKAAIEIGGESFEFGGLWVTPSIDEERELVHIKAWHPKFEDCGDVDVRMVLYIMLDEVLGEFGTDHWLGAIETSDAKLAAAIPCIELRDYLHDLELERGWKKVDPTESYSGYEVDKSMGEGLRADIYVGTTINFPLVRDFPFDDDPIAGSGAEFIYVAFPADYLPKGAQVDRRAEIEDAIMEMLGDRGRCLGGAMGRENAYIDLLLFGGEAAMDLVEAVLRKEGMPKGTGIHFFAPHQEGRRRVL